MCNLPAQEFTFQSYPHMEVTEWCGIHQKEKETMRRLYPNRRLLKLLYLNDGQKRVTFTEKEHPQNGGEIIMLYLPWKPRENRK